MTQSTTNIRKPRKSVSLPVRHVDYEYHGCIDRDDDIADYYPQPTPIRAVILG